MNDFIGELFVVPRARTRPASRQRVRAQIATQRSLDRQWERVSYEEIPPRVRSLARAKRAMDEREIGGLFAYRQSLIDIAALCEEIACTLPEPVMRQAPRRAA